MFPKAMDDGLQVYAVDQLDLSADEAKAFARRCHDIDSMNAQYDLTSVKMSGGSHPIPSLKDRLERAMGQAAGEVHRKQQIDLANSSSGTPRRSPFGLPTGVPNAQPLPSAGLRVVGKGEGGGSVPNVPPTGALAGYRSAFSPQVTALPPNSGARYTQPGSNEITPLSPNPTPPAQPESSPEDNAGAQGLNPYAGRIMATDGRMMDAADMNDAELEAAKQMHQGLGNGREVVAIQWEQARRANNTQAGPMGYA